MKIYELIQELERREVKLTLQDDGRLKFWPESKARNLLPEMKKHKYWLCEYVLGRYALTEQCVNEQVCAAGTIPFAILSDLFPRELIEEAKKRGSIVEQANSCYRLPTEKEWREKRRRRAA